MSSAVNPRATTKAPRIARAVNRTFDSFGSIGLASLPGFAHRHELGDEVFLGNIDGRAGDGGALVVLGRLGRAWDVLVGLDGPRLEVLDLGRGERAEQAAEGSVGRIWREHLEATADVVGPAT